MARCVADVARLVIEAVNIAEYAQLLTCRICRIKYTKI